MTAAKPVSIASFTHLGYEKDLKSEVTYYSTTDIAAQNLLNNLYVLDMEDPFDLPVDSITTPVPGGKFIPRMLYLTDTLTNGRFFDARTAVIDLFDRFTAKKVGHESILHVFPGLNRSLQVSQQAGNVGVVYGTTAHPDSLIDQLEAERRHFPNADPTLSKRMAEPSRSFELADYILYISEYPKQTYIEKGFPEDRLLKVGPLGVDTEHFHPSSIDNEHFEVLSVANMTALKGTKYLLDAWQQLEIQDARLTLCGTMTDEVADVIGPIIDSMETVTHEGYVSDPLSYYQRASLLVHPSLTESFAKVVAEAMACATPVIITEHGPVDYVGSSGKIVPIRDSEAIATAIQYFYDNPAEARKAGNNGRKTAKSNTWEDFSRRVRRAHERIIEREEISME